MRRFGIVVVRLVWLGSRGRRKEYRDESIWVIVKEFCILGLMGDIGKYRVGSIFFL